MSADVRGFYLVLGVELPASNNEWIPVSCITDAGEHAHEDRNSSAAIHSESGVHHCQVHGATSPYDVALSIMQDKRQVMDLLVRHGLREGQPEGTQNGHRRIVEAYDYVDEQGERLFQNVRFDPKTFSQRRSDGNGGWIWNIKGVRRVIYRLPRVIEAINAKTPIWVCEGEKDVHALEGAGQVATTNPMGATSWRKEYTEMLRGATVTVVADSDTAGLKHARQVAASLQGVAETVALVGVPDGRKDVFDHLEAGGRLDELLQLPDSTERTERTRKTPVTTGDLPFGSRPNTDRTPTERPDPPSLATDGRILDRLDEAMGTLGLVGERHIARAAYLVHVSRLLKAPARAVVKGDSSTGKSYAVECALKAAAPAFLWTRTSTSPLALFYSEESFRHRTLVVYEANKLGDDDDPLARVLRTLLSEGRLAYEVTDAKRRTTELLEREGPVAFISTVARASLDKEIETRILSLHSDGSDEMTENVVRALLNAAAEPPVEQDLSEWHQLDRWLAYGPSDVVVPWGPALAASNLSGPPRLRRDITNLLALARAHALLHQQTRDVDSRGRIVATLDDYQVVCELLADALAIATDKAVRSGTRAIVEAVASLRQEDTSPVSMNAAARKAGRSSSTTHTDVHDALDRGYLVNRARNDRSYDLDLGDPLPGRGELLPSREELEARSGTDHSVAVRSPFGAGPNAESPVKTTDSRDRSVRSVESNMEPGSLLGENPEGEATTSAPAPGGGLMEAACAWWDGREG